MKKYDALSVCITGLIIAIIYYSPLAKEGAINGFSLCTNVIMPALLPVLILTNLIIKSKCSFLFDKLFGWLVSRVLKLPKSSATAIVFGLIAGYPAGALLTMHLFDSGAIDSKTATKIMRFNFSGGLAFTITAIGTVCYSSTKTGVVLFVINLLSSIIIGIVSGHLDKNDFFNEDFVPKRLGVTDALVEAVDKSVAGILTMCAFIILFSCVCAIMPIPKAVIPILEITNGLCKGTLYPIPVIAFFLSFGGICIHFQIFGVLNHMGVKYYDFLVFRLFSAGISYLLGLAYCKLFPSEQSVFCSFTTPIQHDFNEVSNTLSVVMLLGCIVLIYDIKNRIFGIKKRT